MSILTRLRNSFVTGLLLVTPLAVTVFVLQFVFTRVTAILRPLVLRVSPVLSDTLQYSGDLVLLAQVLSALIIASFLTLLGYATSVSLGQRLFGSFERGVRLVPLVRTIYFGVRQVSESLVERSAGYDHVVVVEYPREGVYTLGFVTNEAPAAVEDAADGTEPLYNVFLPHSPNPTAGALVMVPESEVYELEMSVRKGLRLLVTTGLSTDEVDELPRGVVAD